MEKTWTFHSYHVIALTMKGKLFFNFLKNGKKFKFNVHIFLDFLELLHIQLKL